MKWLYKILRLVKCPHKYTIIKQVQCCDPEANEKWTRYYCQCKYCGKIKIFD